MSRVMRSSAWPAKTLTQLGSRHAWVRGLRETGWKVELQKASHHANPLCRGYAQGTWLTGHKSSPETEQFFLSFENPSLPVT